jgi:RNA polymerase sigma factor (sigma-70 family)
VVAATVRVTRDFDRAEECVQDAYTRALSAWPDRGIPDRPGAWLTTVARRRALDLIRSEARAPAATALLVDGAEQLELRTGWEIPDDRLRLVFTCCHPALSREAQVALTLRLLCGLSTAEVARAFLVTEPTMAARITRAKKKILAAHIPYRVPPAAELPERVGAVLAVVHLLFTTGHTAPVGSDLTRPELVDRSIDLARMLRALLPGQAGITGLLAMILLTDARRATRVDGAGRLLRLEEQDRTRWDPAAIGEGVALVTDALAAEPADRYALQAAIAAVHASAPTWAATDWASIVGYYDRLGAVWPSPVVALNRAVAVGMAAGPAEGLRALDTVAGDDRLARYGYVFAARAHFLRRLGRFDEARVAYEAALALTDNEVERGFLAEQLAQLSGGGPPR